MVACAAASSGRLAEASAYDELSIALDTRSSRDRSTPSIGRPHPSSTSRPVARSASVEAATCSAFPHPDKLIALGEDCPPKGEECQYLSSVQRSPIGVRESTVQLGARSPQAFRAKKFPWPRLPLSLVGGIDRARARSRFSDHVDSITQASQKIYGPRAYPSDPISGHDVSLERHPHGQMRGRGSMEQLALEIGRAIRRARLDRGMTLKQLAESSDGRFRPTSLAGYERGERTISVVRFCELCRLLDVSPGRLLEEIARTITGTGSRRSISRSSSAPRTGGRADRRLHQAGARATSRCGRRHDRASSRRRGGARFGRGDHTGRVA